MEDEGFLDDSFIEEAARDYVAQHGFNAVYVLRERGRIAARAGDEIAAQTWREIAETAAEILGVSLE